MRVCVQGFIKDFEFWEGGIPKIGVDVEGGTSNQFQK